MGFIQRVATGYATPASAPSSITVAVASAVTQAGSLIVAVGFGNEAGTVLSVTDSQGGVYVHDASAAVAVTNGRGLEMWRCPIARSLTVSDTITVTVSAAQDHGITVIVDQFTYLGTPDVVNYNYSLSYVASGSVTIAATAIDTVAYSAISVNGAEGSVTIGGAFTASGAAELAPSDPGISSQGAYDASPAGSVTATWSWPSTHTYVAFLLGYPPAQIVYPQPPAVVVPRSPRRIARALLGGAFAISAGISPPSSLIAGPVIPVTVTAVPGNVTGALMIVQQVSGTSTLDYGWSTVNMTTTAGNALVILAGWDLSTSATAAAMPAVYVTDSAGNRWEHVATSTSGVAGARAAAWVAVNALAVTWVSVSLTSFASSLAYTILEIANMPQNFSLDAAAANAQSDGVSLDVIPGAAGTSDIAFSVLAAGAANLTAIQGGAVTTVYGFESGTMGFTGSSATVAQSAVWASEGVFSLQVTSAGTSPTQWGAASASVAVVASTFAYGTAQIYAPAPLAAARVNLDWYDASHVFISTSAGVATPVGAGQVLTVSVVAQSGPANAAFVQISVVDSENSPAGTTFYTDQVTLNVTSPPALGWTALATVTAGASSASPVTIYPFWAPAAAGSSLDTAYTLPQVAPMAGVTFGISASAASPVQPNPEFPVLKVEAAFGALPGDPSQSPPDWTDLTARAIAQDGNTYITASMGREYELTTTEAGSLEVSASNHDGALTPGNTSSPFSPDVVVLTPLRVAAYWAGRWYPVAAGYVQSWPQEWPDLPQWGITKIKAADAVAVLTSLNMPSALDGEVLLDGPYVMIPCNEQYTTFVNGINPTFVASDAQGLLASNISRSNQRAGFYVDGTAATAATGQSTQLLGDQDSGFGTSSISTAPTASASGPGMVYTDPGLPDPLSPNGVTVEFWVLISATVASANLQPVVFSAYGPASNYQAATPSLQVKINNQTGSSTLSVVLADGSVVTATFSVSPSPQQIALTLTPTALSVYVNGALTATATITSAQVSVWKAITLGCPNYAYQAGTITAGNFTAFDLAVFPYVLPPQRINSHYVTGFSGQQNVDATTRIAQILAWGNAGIPRGGQTSFSGAADGVTQGPAYSLNGASAASAINVVAANHSAMAVVSPAGSLVFWHKWALFNQAPVAVFGDSPLPGSTEIPFLPASSYDYDTTYTYNADQVTQVDGPNTTITVAAYDFGSQASYFPRSALTQQISTTSDLDAYDQANWNIAKYSQPSLRVKGVTIDAAANPAAAFPVILSLQQGQVAVVTRRPLGGAVISETFIIQKITHDIGPGVWKTSLQLSPYSLESAILTLGTPGYDTPGGRALT